MEKNLYSMRYINTEGKTFGMNVCQIEKYQATSFYNAVRCFSGLVVNGTTSMPDGVPLKYHVDKIVGAMYDLYLDEIMIKINIDKKLERVNIVVKYEDEKGDEQRSNLYIENIERS